MMMETIDENSHREVLLEYMFQKYGRRIEEFYGNLIQYFPYEAKGMDWNLHLKDFIEWLLIEKPLPETGKTIVEEFVEEHNELDAETKQKFLQMKNVVASEFIVLSKDKMTLKVKDTKTERCYCVKLLDKNPSIWANSLLKGRIYPFGSHYYFPGAIAIHNSPMILSTDVLMEGYNRGRIKDAESSIISKNTKLTAALNKYPCQWIDGICKTFSISAKGRRGDKAWQIAEYLLENISAVINGLPEKSKSALRNVLNSGGIVKYTALKDYDDDISFWWNNEPPASTIGILRLKGLLIVGRLPVSGKMYKAAAIPVEVRELLEDYNWYAAQSYRGNMGARDNDEGRKRN